MNIRIGVEHVVHFKKEEKGRQVPLRYYMLFGWKKVRMWYTERIWSFGLLNPASFDSFNNKCMYRRNNKNFIPDYTRESYLA